MAVFLDLVCLFWCFCYHHSFWHPEFPPPLYCLFFLYDTEGLGGGADAANSGPIGLGTLDMWDPEKREKTEIMKWRIVSDRKTIYLMETFSASSIWLYSYSKKMEVFFFSTPGLQLQLSGSMCQLIGLWAIVTCITFKPEHLVAAARSSSFGSTCQGQLWSILLRWGIKTWYKVTYVEQNP